MKERVISLSILVFSLVYLAGSISLSVGTIAKPGPGFLPAGIAFALLVVAGFNVYKAFRASIEPAGDGSWLQATPIGIALILFAYPLLLKPLSFIISTCVVLFILFRLLKFKTVLISLITSIGTAFVSFYVFSNILGVVLPTGFIEDMILRL